MRYVIALSLLMIAGGCASTRQPSIVPFESWSARSQEYVQKNASYPVLRLEGKSLVQIQAVVKQAESDFQSSSTERDKYIAGVEKTYESILANSPPVFTEMRQIADGYSNRSLLVSGVGVVSGLTSAVLLVANPANAVWAAGFSGLASGAAGFQARLAQESFTRAAMYREYTRLSTEFITAQKEYVAGYSYLVANRSNPNASDWDANIAKVESGLAGMERIIVLKYFTMGTDADVEAAKKREQELIDAVKKIQADLDTILKKGAEGGALPAGGTPPTGGDGGSTPPS